MCCSPDHVPVRDFKAHVLQHNIVHRLCTLCDFKDFWLNVSVCANQMLNSDEERGSSLLCWPYPVVRKPLLFAITKFEMVFSSLITDR